MYHYQESGLPYIWLADGFTRHQTPYGEAISIIDIDDLHRAIARTVVEQLPHIGGQELRFLRLELDYSPAQLAQSLGLDEQSITEWEQSPSQPVPTAVDRLLRLWVEAWLEEHQALATALQRTTKASQNPMPQRLPFMHQKAWKAAA